MELLTIERYWKHVLWYRLSLVDQIVPGTFISSKNLWSFKAKEICDLWGGESEPLFGSRRADRWVGLQLGGLCHERASTASPGADLTRLLSLPMICLDSCAFRCSFRYLFIWFHVISCADSCFTCRQSVKNFAVQLDYWILPVVYCCRHTRFSTKRVFPFRQSWYPARLVMSCWQFRRLFWPSLACFLKLLCFDPVIFKDMICYINKFIYIFVYINK